MATAPSNNAPIVNDEGFMFQPLRLFFVAISRLFILEGSGSPEGVLEALPLRLYMDTAGTAGAILYIKRDDAIAGNKKQGWVLI